MKKYNWQDVCLIFTIFLKAPNNVLRIVLNVVHKLFQIHIFLLFCSITFDHRIPYQEVSKEHIFADFKLLSSYLNLHKPTSTEIELLCAKQDYLNYLVNIRQFLLIKIFIHGEVSTTRQ